MTQPTDVLWTGFCAGVSADLAAVPPPQTRLWIRSVFSKLASALGLAIVLFVAGLEGPPVLAQLAPSSDVEPRTGADPGTAIGPTAQSVALGCDDFAFSDIAGFGAGVSSPFNAPGNQFMGGRFVFDPENPGNLACTDRTVSNNIQPGMTGQISDKDRNGQADACQQISIVDHNLAGGQVTQIRRQVRNRFYDGTDAASNPAGPQSLDVHQQLDFGGVTVTRDSVDLTDPVYRETLTFTSPGGVQTLGENLSIDLSPGAGGGTMVAPGKYRASDWLFAGSHDGLSTSTLDGFESAKLSSGTDTRLPTDLEPATDGALSPTLSAQPLRDLAETPNGNQVYIASGNNLFVYDAVGRSLLDLDPAGSGVGIAIGDKTQTVDVEPAGQFAYVASTRMGSPSTDVAEVTVLDTTSHQVMTTVQIGPDDIPIDVKVANMGTSPTKAILYLTRVTFESGTCAGGPSQVGALEEPETLPGPWPRTVKPPLPLVASLDPFMGVAAALDAIRIPVNALLQVTIEVCGPGHENDPGCGVCGPGECLGSGGPQHRRNIRLSAWDMDRVTGFANPLPLNDILISCVDHNGNIPLDIGLDIASDGRILMASPDTDKLLVFDTDPTTGALSATPSQSIALGWTPCDVEVGQGVDSLKNPAEVAIVIGTDHAAAEKGMIRIFQDLSNFATFTIGEVTGLGTAPVSATISENGSTVFVAHEGAGEIRANKIQDGSEIPNPQAPLQPLALPVSGTLRRVVIQRSTP